LASPATADPYSPFRPKGIRDGAVATVPPTGVAFWWRLGGMCGVSIDKTPHAKTLILQDFEACVAFVAFVFSILDLEEKAEVDSSHLPTAPCHR